MLNLKQTVMIEVWRAVVGYEGYYEVSNWGRVRSLPRKTTKGIILKPIKNKYGYLRVSLCKEGETKNFSVHRLVGMAFADMVGWTEKAKGKPFEELQINHKDQNKENNFVFVGEDGSADFSKSNLEWCDGPYNIKYGTGIERRAKTQSITKKGYYNTKISKAVYQYTLDGEFIKEYPSASEVQRQTGWYQGNISACCRGQFKQVYGYVWRYIEKTAPDTEAVSV